MNANLRIVCPQCDAINRVPEARLGDGPRRGACLMRINAAPQRGAHVCRQRPSGPVK
ncbi:hypothetical protein [Roseomonas rosulenta]|uniref:hypothetical protein n=1 Tax=Roseomonas rosulenta TaxID=2748667 RepID=UPI0034E1B721